MPRAMASSSPPPVNTYWPRLPLTMAVPGVLAHRQHAAGRDAGVLQQVEGDEAVVGRGLRVVEDVAQLLEVPGPQEVGDVRASPRWVSSVSASRLDLDEAALRRVERGHAVGGQQAVRRLVVADREEVLVGELRHGGHGIRCGCRPSVRPP